jgi:hypothetical protein
MKHGLSKWLERLQFIFLFLALTVLVHGFFGWFHNWLVPDDPYKVPQGHASKVFQAGESGGPPDASPGDRLRLFYWLGE